MDKKEKNKKILIIVELIALAVFLLAVIGCFVVQLAFETMSISFVYLLLLTPITNIGISFPGAVTTTFFASGNSLSITFFIFNPSNSSPFFITLFNEYTASS